MLVYPSLLQLNIVSNLETDSVVMAVHNDDKVLPYSLNCLAKFDGEIIIVFDNPTQASRGHVERFVKRYPKTVIVEKDKLPYPVENVVWSSYLYGSLFASGNRIFWVGADFVFPPIIFKLDIPLPCRFEYVDADNHLTYAWSKLLGKFSKHYALSVFPRGFPFHKYHWLSEEKMGNHNYTPISFHLVNSPLILHLRSNRNRLRHWFQGRTRKKRGTNLLKVLLHSVLLRKPYVLLGWIHEALMHKQC